LGNLFQLSILFPWIRENGKNEGNKLGFEEFSKEQPSMGDLSEHDKGGWER